MDGGLWRERGNVLWCMCVCYDGALCIMPLYRVQASPSVNQTSHLPEYPKAHWIFVCFFFFSIPNLPPGSGSFIPGLDLAIIAGKILVVSITYSES